MTTHGTHLAVRLFAATEWQHKALCRGRPTSLFFADESSENHNGSLTLSDRVAKSLCARCPVRRDCLEYGLHDEYGIWGGTKPPERKARTDIDTLLAEMDEQVESFVKGW